MNLLAAGFLFLNLFMFVTGFLVNYVSAIVPQSFGQIFRYGRANMSNSKPSLIRKIEIPKRWFWHFYLYAVLLQIAVTATVISSILTGSSGTWLFSLLKYVGDREITASSTSTIIATTLFLCHLCRRLYETLYVSIYSNTKMNVFHYILAYIHYTGAILCLVAHSPYFASAVIADMHKLEPISAKEITGIVIFILGNYIQNRAHVGLANLRKGKDKKEASRHKIPRGGLFEYVSCPNYFGEILIYTALVSLFGFNNSTFNHCACWVVCNQITSGIMNHIWYKDTFKDYPKQRKAVIPYLL